MIDPSRRQVLTQDEGFFGWKNGLEKVELTVGSKRAVCLPEIGKTVKGVTMIRIHFTDLEAKRRALGFLAGRFSFKSWATGEMIVPEPALASLAREGISFIVKGPATHLLRQTTAALDVPFVRICSMA